MCGHPMSDWPEIWQGTYWSHFKMIHRLCLGKQGPGELRRWEACFSFRASISGQMMSKWPEIWRGAFWMYFEIIHRIGSKIWCLRCWRRWELLFSCRRAKLGQMILEWPETSCVLFFWLSWTILQFLFDSDIIGFFGSSIAYFWQVLRLHVASWCWGGKVTFLVSTNAPSRYCDELLNFCSRCASKRFFWRREHAAWPRVFEQSFFWYL